MVAHLFLNRFLRVLTLKPFDTSTDQGIRAERQRRIILTGISSAATRGVSTLSGLILVPITLGFLGEERYGLWMAITSTVAMLGFTDLGLGNAVVNAVAAAHGRDDREAARACVSNALAAFGTISVAIVVGFCLAYEHVDWGKLYNVTASGAAAEAGPATALSIVCLAAALPFSVVNRVLVASQAGFEANAWVAAANVLVVAVVIVAVRAQFGIPGLVVATAGTPVVVALASGVFTIRKRMPWLVPRWTDVRFQSVRQLFRVGTLFLISQLATVLAFMSDNFIIAQALGARSVPQYVVPARLFGVISMVMWTLLQPLWPAYIEAVARKDLIWIRQTVVRSLLVTLVVSGTMASILVVGGGRIIDLWVGTVVAPTSGLLLGLGVWAVVQSMGTAIAMLLNAFDKLALQAVLATLMGPLVLLTKIVVIESMGLSGIVWATVGVYLLVVGIPLAVIVPRLIAAMSSKR